MSPGVVIIEPRDAFRIEDPYGITAYQWVLRRFDQALFELYRKGAISMEEALSNADSRANLEAKINFG